MNWFEIELNASDGWVRRYIVHAKTYEEAANKVRQHDGDGTFKLLGVFEYMETDKKMLKRIG